MIIIAAAFVFGRLGKRFLHQPLAVGEIAAGIILGPSVFGAICNCSQIISTRRTSAKFR